MIERIGQRACGFLRRGERCWAKAASGDSISVNRAICNGFLICSSSATTQFMVFGKTLSGGAALFAAQAGNITALQPARLLRLPGGGATFVAA